MDLIIVQKVTTARVMVYRAEIQLVDENGEILDEFYTEYEKAQLSRAANASLREAIEKGRDLGFDHFIVESDAKRVLRLPHDCEYLEAEPYDYEEEDDI